MGFRILHSSNAPGIKVKELRGARAICHTTHQPYTFINYFSKFFNHIGAFMQ